MSDRAPASEQVPRGVRVWKTWLRALAGDAEAALAAAMAYEQLDTASRDAWLDSLSEDAPTLAVPSVAVYAPLLAVEDDPARRERIEAAVQEAGAPPPSSSKVRALSGYSANGNKVLALISPLYLDFVQVLACELTASGQFEWVRHDPIVRSSDSPQAGNHLMDVPVEDAPVCCIVDDLARSIVAQTRRGEPVPIALRSFAHLFQPVTY